MTRSRLHDAQGRVVAALCVALAGCASEPLVPFSTETAPLILVPAAQAGVQDKRGRFREIYCAVLAARVGEVPDHRPCEDALTRLGSEPAGAASRCRSARRAGIWSPRWCRASATRASRTGCSPRARSTSTSRKYGYALTAIPVDALSGTTVNARQIRDWVMARDPGPARRASC